MDLDQVQQDQLVHELFKYTLSLQPKDMKEKLHEMTEAVLAKRRKRDELHAEFAQWLMLLENNGISCEPVVQHQMFCAGHGHRWREVQAMGRELFKVKNGSILSPPTQPNGAFLPTSTHTPCLVTTMHDGTTVYTPMAPSPSPLGIAGVMPPLLPMVLPATGFPAMDGVLPMAGMQQKFNGLDEQLVLPQLGFERSKSMPQSSLKINILEDSIKAPTQWVPMMVNPNQIANHASAEPSAISYVNQTPAIPQRSRSRSRDNYNTELPLPTGPIAADNRSPSVERERSFEKGIMNVPILSKVARSNSMPTLGKGESGSSRNSSRRRRRNKQPTKRELAEAKLKELSAKYGPRFTRTGMRGENVLRLKAKTKRALENIVPFIQFLDERIQLEEVSCPLSKPTKEHVRGFLAYIRTNTVEEAAGIHDVLFPEYCEQNRTAEGVSPFKLIELNPMAKGAKAALQQEHKI